MSRRKLVILLGLAGLVACMPQLETSNLPITERNIAAKAATMTGASVLDTDRYTPSAVLAGCSEENQFPIEKIGSAELKSAIEQAQTYSDSQRGNALPVIIPSPSNELQLDEVFEQNRIRSRKPAVSSAKLK